MLYESGNRWTVQHYQRKMCLECQRKGPPKILEFHMQEAGYLRQDTCLSHQDTHQDTCLRLLLYQSKTVVKSFVIFPQLYQTQCSSSVRYRRKKKRKEALINDESEDSKQKHDHV